MDRITRSMLMVAVAGLLASGCSFSASVGGGTVAADDVEAAIVEQLGAQFPVESADCPNDLDPEVGATTVCTMVSEGKSFEVTATVDAVEGEDVSYTVEVTKEL